MSWESFKREYDRVLKGQESDDSDLTALDSLSLTEICVLAEEELGVSVEFQDLYKKIHTTEDVKKILLSKGATVGD